MKRCGWLLLVVAIAGLYLPTVGYGFLRYDDPGYTFANPFVASGFTLANLGAAFTNLAYNAIWMPVTWLSYQLSVTAFGPGPAGHHLVSVAIHLVNSLLLFRLLRRCTETDLLPALLALIWALHPQCAESVCWIASRKELMWTMFTLVGLLTRRLWLVYLCCALACMSKPTAMVFPILFLLTDFTRRRVYQSVPLFLMAAATGALAMYSQTHPEGMNELALYYAPLWERMLNAANAVGLDFLQNFLPLGICIDHRFVHGLPIGWYFGLPVFVSLVAAAFLVARKKSLRHPFIICLAFFLCVLLPTLGLFASFGEHARADRFLYLASIAIPLFIVKTCPAPTRRTCLLLAVFLIAILPVSWIVVRSYRTDTTAFERVLAVDPENPRALAHIGEARCANGDFTSGIEMLRRSRDARPADNTVAGLAYALMRRGSSADLAEIRGIYGDRIPPTAKGLEALGAAEIASGNFRKAADHLVASINAPGRNYSAEDAKLLLIRAWQNSGRHKEAVRLAEIMVKSTRKDIAAKAELMLEALSDSPTALICF